MINFDQIWKTSKAIIGLQVQGTAMPNVVPIFKNETLEPDTLRVLGASYDAAARILAAAEPLNGDEEEALAFLLLGLVRSGVKNTDLLTLKAVTALGERTHHVE